MVNVSALCEWTRIGRFGLHRRREILPSGNGLLATITSYDDQGNQSITTASYDEEAIKKAAEECRLATSDDILYLISPMDVVEVSTPDEHGVYSRRRLNAEPPEDGDLSTFHVDIARMLANPEGLELPKGTFVSAIFAAPGDDPMEPLRMLAHRDGPEDDWETGPRTPLKRKAGSTTDDLADTTLGKKKYTF